MGARIVNLKALSYNYGGYPPPMSRPAEGVAGGAMKAEDAEYNQMIVPNAVTTTVYVYATYEIKYGP